MKFTKEEAIKYHKQMWTDMQKELGDNPSESARLMFKTDWCKSHFPHMHITANCFLCEYANNHSMHFNECDDCPIIWGPAKESFYCIDDGNTIYTTSPISEILALPERVVLE